VIIKKKNYLSSNSVRVWWIRKFHGNK